MRCRKTLLLCAAILAVPSFALQPIWIRPAAPSTTDKFMMRILAIGCISDVSAVASAAPPRIDVVLTSAPCPSFPFGPPFTGPTVVFQNFAPRAAGDYHVTVRSKSSGAETILSEGRLVVHEDVPDVEVRPWVAAVAGGTELRVRGHDPLCLHSNCPETGIVTIDGQPFTARYQPDELIVDAAPPHAEGAVDVGIRYNGKDLRSNALLFYYDPRHEPEWSVFEPVLLPVLDGGAGILGSMWQTEAMVSREPGYFVAAGAPASANDAGDVRPLPGRGFPNGAIFAVPRRESEWTHFALRLREVSRNPDAYGTELPVVREKDFAGPRLNLYDVPVGPRFRTKVRVYSLDPPEGSTGEAVVTYTRSGTKREVASLPLRWTRPPCTYESCPPAYAELNFNRADSDRLDFYFWTNDATAWAFATAVDNTTQAVSVITPR